MSFLKKVFSPAPGAAPAATEKTGTEALWEALEAQEAQVYDIDLVPGGAYRLTQNMYLFPDQEVTSATNDYVVAGDKVTFLVAGETVEINRLLAPWVSVRSAKGKVGWCYAHFLVRDAENTLP
jgi:hypothetical protein